MKQCDNGSYCCGSANQAINLNATRCCQQGNGFFLKDGVITQANQTAPTSVAGPTITGVPASAASPIVSPTPTPVPSKPSHTGAIVGGVIGGIAGLALIAAIVFFILRRSRQPRQQEAPVKELGGSGLYPTHELPYAAPPGEMGNTEVLEKDSTPVERFK